MSCGHQRDTWQSTVAALAAVILLMAEIRRSPVEVGSLSHYLQGFIHPRWLFGISAINR